MITEAVSSPHDLSLRITITDPLMRSALRALCMRVEQLDLACCGSAPTVSEAQGSKPESKVPAHDPAAMKKMISVRLRIESIISAVDEFGEREHQDAVPDWDGAQSDHARRIREEQAKMVKPRLIRHLSAKAEGIAT